jgi:hypothetical protein
MNHPRTSALIDHIRQRDGQVGVGLRNAPEEWVTLCRSLEDELAEALAERDAARAALDIALVQ